jgi:signal transduction histidine kinase
MPAPSPPTLLRAITPGGWTALAWCVATTYSFGVQRPWPGESWERTGGKSHLADPLAMDCQEKAALLFAAVLLCAACRLLDRRPPASMTMLVLSALALTNGPLHANAIAPEQYLPVCVALGFVTARGTGRISLVAVGLAGVGLFGYIAARVAVGMTVGTSVEAVVLMMVVVAWVIGNAQRSARAHAARTRAHVAEQAMTAERLRIARELHDMVAHSIGVVAFQAGAAKRVIDTRPESARQALGVIEATSRETLAGLRRLLGALHAAGPDSEERPPAGLGDIGTLVENVRTVGVRVEVEWRGERRLLPPEIDLSAFRIIQESVTNVVKHAGTHICRVSLVFHPADLLVAIVDSGSGNGSGNGSKGEDRSAGESAGYGIAGMRERVRLLHGDFDAGPRPGGGFRVTARLPLPAEV